MVHDPPDEDEDGDDLEDEDDDEGGDEGDEEDEEDDDGGGGEEYSRESGPHDRLAFSRLGAPPAGGALPPPAQPTTPTYPATRDHNGRFVGRRPSRPFFELTNADVFTVDIRKVEYNNELKRVAERFVRAVGRPFPSDNLQGFLGWVRSEFGPGVYRLIQRGDERYMSSRTFDLTEGVPQSPPLQPPLANGNGHAAPVAPANPSLGAYSGMDYRTALVVVGIPALAQLVKTFSAPRSQLSEMVELMKMTQVSSAERGEIFKQALELARELEPPPAAQSSDGVDMGQLGSLIGEVLKAFRQAPPPQPAAKPVAAITQPATPAPAAAVAPAPTPSNPAQLLEQMIFAEIQRAISQGDTPECLVIILETWLDDLALDWITNTDTETVLEELPMRYTAHADYLKTDPVRDFLRSAIRMIQEDREAEANEALHEPAAT